MKNGDTIHLAGLYLDELEAWLKEHQVATFRSKQIFHWIHHQAVLSFREMTNLPKDLITLLETEFQEVLPLQLVTTKVSQDGTEKYLFSLDDHSTIETVLIPEEQRQTICVSAQVGCAMNCSFCATGQGGYVRNLSAGEIVAQVLWVENRLKKRGLTISNVVYMGMGEPLANYNNVLKSMYLLNDPQGLNVGARRMTISTCGLAPQIRALAEEKLQFNLAISLHATNDSHRSEIMPVNKRFPLRELLAACDFYIQKTGRRVSFEYALIDGFNDALEDARQLRDLLQNRLCHVNVIPINPVGDEQRPASHRITEFAEILEAGNIPVSIRKERGTDIEAACGQLRQSNFQE